MVEINRDPEVSRYLNRPADEPAVAAFFGQIVGHWEQHGSVRGRLSPLNRGSRSVSSGSRV